MNYEDFVVQIGPRAGEGYSVHVVKSPAGEGAGLLRLPQGGGPALRRLERWQERGDACTCDPAAEEGIEPASPCVVGASLFRALFEGKVRSLLDQSLGMTGAKAQCGLRIHLKLDPEHPDLAKLYSLPWELLYRPDTQDFLSLSRLTPIVRNLDVSRPPAPYPLPSPLRILALVASPSGLQPLDLRKEKRNIEAAWDRHRGVELVFLPEASPGALREELLERPFHVFHFMGHGGFEERSGEGVLFFSRPQGGPLPVSGAVLASKLKDFKSLRLVFLNACNTARAAGPEGVNPFAGVASALVLGGIPAVVAMQFPISDQAAIAFSRSFYRRLAAGDPVDSAVTEGRQAVHSVDAEASEWATPVLFLRTPDGSLFSRAGTGPVPTAAPARGLLSGAAPARRRSRSKAKSLAAAALVLLTIGGVVVSRFALRAEPDQGSTSQEDREMDAKGASRPPAADIQEEKPSSPVVRVKKRSDSPQVIYEFEEGFRSTVEGFTGHLSKVEIYKDRMRWYFHFLNETDRDRQFGFTFPETYVADERGTRYTLIDAENAGDLIENPRQEMTVQKGVRLDRWFEFSPPEAGMRMFTVGLVSHTEFFSDIPKFKTFTVEFPQ